MIGSMKAIWGRVLTFPLVRIELAILSIAIPFAIVSLPLNLFVTDKSLRRVGALLLTAVVLAAYRAYVRVGERRAVTELSSTHAIRELGIGLGFGALLLSVTIGILAALGVYQVTGQIDCGYRRPPNSRYKSSTTRPSPAALFAMRMAWIRSHSLETNPCNTTTPFLSDTVTCVSLKYGSSRSAVSTRNLRASFAGDSGTAGGVGLAVTAGLSVKDARSWAPT